MNDSDTDSHERVHSQLLKLAHDLPFLANATSKPTSVVLAEAKARLRAIEESVGQGEPSPFTRITAEELAVGKFDLTYLNHWAREWCRRSPESPPRNSPWENSS